MATGVVIPKRRRVGCKSTLAMVTLCSDHLKAQTDPLPAAAGCSMPAHRHPPWLARTTPGGRPLCERQSWAHGRLLGGDVQECDRGGGALYTGRSHVGLG